MVVDVTEADSARAATQQALLREVNERVAQMSEDVDPFVPFPGFVCECANGGCVERVALTLFEYEWLREDGRWFCVAPSDDHVSPSVERVVGRYGRFWVAEMTGEAAQMAVDLDPRRRLASMS